MSQFFVVLTKYISPFITTTREKEREIPIRNAHPTPSITNERHLLNDLIRMSESGTGHHERSHCVFLGPLLGVLEILGVVVFEQFCDFWDQRIVGVRITKQRTNGQQDLGDGESRGPLRP